MFKPFYIHRHHPPGKMPNRNARGFTALISPCVIEQFDPESGEKIGERVDHRQVNVQVAFCSPKDQFVKELGRQFAMSAKIETINKRELPELMNTCENEMWEFHREARGHWDWILKHVI